VPTELPVQAISQPVVKFKRDQYVWTYYGLVGLNCYFMAALGPVMPFLRADLHLDYKVAGMHFSAFAIGSMIAGFKGDLITHKLGRVVTLRSTIIIAALAMVLLVTATSSIFSIAAILIVGSCGSLIYQTLASTISDHLEDLRTFAFLEGEVFAMLVAGAAPFVVAGCVMISLGWRAAIILLIVLYLGCIPSLTQFGNVKNSHDPKVLTTGKLSPSFWLFGIIILLSVAVEWSTAFWSADYLASRLMISKATAASTVGAFFIGMVTGRYSGSRLIHCYTSSQLLFVSGLTAIVGFSMFWLGTMVPVNCCGLFLTGLGIANMYPLAFSQAVAASPTMRSTAIARIGLLCGVSILVAPMVLSFIADRHGLFVAYASIAVVLIFCFGSIVLANKIAVQHDNKGAAH
jgi:fucose permease